MARVTWTSFPTFRRIGHAVVRGIANAARMIGAPATRGWVALTVYLGVLYAVLWLQLVDFLTSRQSVASSPFAITAWNALSLPSSALPYLVHRLGYTDLAEQMFFLVPVVNAAVIATTFRALRRRTDASSSRD